MTVWTEEDIKELEEDEIKPIWCPRCLDAGYQVQLGYKILMPGQKRDADYENWLECSKCGFLCPIYEIEPEPDVQNVVETIDNPFESKFEVVGVPKTYTKAGRKASSKKRRNKIKLDDDPEIADLLRIYGDRVNVLK